MKVFEFIEDDPERKQMFKRAVDSLAGELRQKKAYHDKHGAWIDAFVTITNELHDTLSGSAPGSLTPQQQQSPIATATGKDARKELAETLIASSNAWKHSNPNRSLQLLENAQRAIAGQPLKKIY